MSPFMTCSRSGSKVTTSMLPSEMPIDGLNLACHTVPTSIGPSDACRASRTSVCHAGSLTTFVTYANTSSTGRSITMLSDASTIASLSSRSSPVPGLRTEPHVKTGLPDARAGEAAFVNRHARDGDGRVVPLRQLGRQPIGDRAEVLLAHVALEEVERGREVFGGDLQVELHRRRLRVDVHGRAGVSFLV